MLPVLKLRICLNENNKCKEECSMSYMISVDVGGTFTDCAVRETEGGTVFGKALSTPPDFEKGIIDSVASAAENMGISFGEVMSDAMFFSHGSTVATNIMATHKGSKVGLITTAGHEDTMLFMRIKGRYVGKGEEYIKHMNASNKPLPIVGRPMIKGVMERIDYKGEVVIPLDFEGVKSAAKELIDAGAESIAVGFLWSVKNDTHEQHAKKIILEMFPDLHVSVASELAPKVGEYERISTAVINSYVGPETESYLKSLAKELKDKGLEKDPFIMQAHGGCLPLTSIKPVSMIGSGPVGGVIGSQYIGDVLGYKNVITTDVGGTTFDVGMIYEGRLDYSMDPSVEQYSLSTPCVDITSIGAGGGSIARIDPLTNLLKVGPRSAGAVPGPVCYGRGGEEPTLCDADCILGYLNPDFFLGGKVKLDKDAARSVFEKKIARPLGMSVREAAIGVSEISNNQMADLVRNITVGRGHDPRTCILFAFGGNGPVHATEYGSEAKAIVVPFSASVHSAFGIMSTDVVHAYEKAKPIPAPAPLDMVESVFAELEEKATADLKREGFQDNEIELKRHVEMRYMRQVYEVRTPVPPGELTEEIMKQVYDEFEILYERLYGKGSAFREAGMMIVNFGIYGYGLINKPSLIKSEIGSRDPSKAHIGTRKAYFRDKSASVMGDWEKWFVDADVFDFSKLASGNVVPGPAIIETPITTIVISSDSQGAVDEYKNVVITKKEG
jgi:N-methylhydantoinase A